MAGERSVPGNAASAEGQAVAVLAMVRDTQIDFCYIQGVKERRSQRRFKSRKTPDNHGNATDRYVRETIW